MFSYMYSVLGGVEAVEGAKTNRISVIRPPPPRNLRYIPCRRGRVKEANAKAETGRVFHYFERVGHVDVPAQPREGSEDSKRKEAEFGLEVEPERDVSDSAAADAADG